MSFLFIKPNTFQIQSIHFASNLFSSFIKSPRAGLGNRLRGDGIRSADCFHRTNLSTLTAVGTFWIINGCMIICYGNGLDRTGFLAFHTSDAAGLAHLPGLGAIILVDTKHMMRMAGRNNSNNPFRACFCANTAADTSLCIYCGQTVANGNGIFRAGGSTVSIA